MTMDELNETIPVMGSWNWGGIEGLNVPIVRNSLLGISLNSSRLFDLYTTSLRPWKR